MLVVEVALSLGAMILPIGPELVGECVLQLLMQRTFVFAERLEPGVSGGGPEDAAVLLARATDSLDLGDGAFLLHESREHEVDGLEPHGHGRKHFALLLVGLHTLGDAIFGPKVGVEVDLGLRDDFEVGGDHNSCRSGGEL